MIVGLHRVSADGGVGVHAHVAVGGPAVRARESFWTVDQAAAQRDLRGNGAVDLGGASCRDVEVMCVCA